MLISAYQPLTLLDYPGKISSLVFTLGCNFKCHYCHNPEFINIKNFSKKNLIPEEKIFMHLKKRVGLLEGVVITGGEPTVQKDLIFFIKKIKSLGFLVKLDTNGANPKILEKLIKEKLIDYIAMDIKASRKKYEGIVDTKINTKKIKQSADIIQRSNVSYEFRTTVLPKYHDEKEMEQIGTFINKAEKYYIQNFWNKKVLNPKFKKLHGFKKKELLEFKKIMEKYVKHCEIRE